MSDVAARQPDRTMAGSRRRKLERSEPRPVIARKTPLRAPEPGVPKQRRRAANGDKLHIIRAWPTTPGNAWWRQLLAAAEGLSSERFTSTELWRPPHRKVEMQSADHARESIVLVDTIVVWNCFLDWPAFRLPAAGTVFITRDELLGAPEETTIKYRQRQ
jgi:hypothetical protein